MVVPIAFTLAGAGKLLGLVFVLYRRLAVGLSRHGWRSCPPSRERASSRRSRASAVSLPFLLDLFRIPSDMFQLYLVVDSVIGEPLQRPDRLDAHAFCLALLAGLRRGRLGDAGA